MSKRVFTRENPWPSERLAVYIAERNRAAAVRIFGEPTDKPRRPLKVQNAKAFNPHRW